MCPVGSSHDFQEIIVKPLVLLHFLISKQPGVDHPEPLGRKPKVESEEFEAWSEGIYR